MSWTRNAEVSRKWRQPTNFVEDTRYPSASTPSLMLATMACGHKFTVIRRLSQNLLSLSKNVIFTNPTCIWCPCWGDFGWPLWNFIKIFGRVPELSYGIVYVIVCLAALIQYRLVTDGQTQGHCIAYIVLAKRCVGKNKCCAFVIFHFYINFCYLYSVVFLADVNWRSRSLLAIAIPSVCCLSPVTLVHPTQAVELIGNFFSPYDSPGTLLFWCQKSLVGDAPFPLKFAFKVTHPLSNSAISTDIGS